MPYVERLRYRKGDKDAIYSGPVFHPKDDTNPVADVAVVSSF